MKSRNYFSLVLFFVFLTFGCTDLYKKDVNTDLEFKIQIPKTRNAQTEAETLKLVVKLSYKDEDTSLEKIVYSTSEKIETITFQNVEVGSEIKISASVFDTENLLFFGETEYKKVEPTNNIFTLTLEKVYVEPEIIDAQVPEISIPLNSIVELATPDSADSIKKQISIGATVSDGGDISFQWQEKVNNAWQNIDGIDEDQVKQNNITERKSHLTITIEKGNTQYYQCIITNTNENANGEKTARITSDEITVAYFEGELSIKATYNSEEYEIFEQEFLDDTNSYDYSVIDIEETYSFTNGETRIFQTQFSSEKYSIAKTNEAEKAIGYVPYTVTYKETSNSEDPISTTVYVPVKYDLSKATFSIVNSSNSVETFIPQYTGEETLQPIISLTSTSEANTIHLYNSENITTSSEYQIKNDIDISWLSNSSIITNSEAGTFEYTATATSKENAWCFGSISSNHTVTVCPWEIAIKDETDLTANKDNLDGDTTYTLSVTNEAEENPSVTWTSDNGDFIISRDSSKLSTPVAGENAQTATITAKVEETVVASIEVTVAAIEYGTETNPITDWSMLARKIENTGGDIYISGEMTAIEEITVAKETNIIAANPVTITRDTSFTDTMFTVNETFTMQGTSGNTITIDGNKENSASGSIFEANSNIDLDYVTIQNCSSEKDGGTLYVNSAIATMSNGTITNCNSKDGGAIYLFSSASLTIKDVDISSCSPQYSGGAVHVNGSTFIMENGTISDCSVGYYGGAVFVTGGSFEMKGTASITNCTAKAGSGIFLSNSIFNISGDSYLDSKCDVFLENTTSSIKIMANLTKDYVATIKLDDSFTVGTQVLKTGEDVTLTEEILGKFTLDNENYVIGSDGSLEAVSSGDDGTIKSVSDLSEYFDSDNECYALTTGTYVFGSDITLDYPIYILSDYSVTLLSNKNVTITSSFKNDNLIYVDRTDDNTCGILTLGGGEGTLTLKHVTTYPTIESYGDLTLDNNCAITESQYCAIQIKNGYFTMEGGEIFNNTYTGTNVQSSAITLDFTGTSYAYFEGGKIYNNKTTTSGGGIMISDNSTMSTIMIEGVEIYNNSASQNGGGIYSDTPNLYINSPSKIYTNYVNDSDCGASIYVTDAETGYDGSIFYFYLDNEAISTNPYNENIDL